MKTVTHLFADITASLEDLHAVSVEGQAPDASGDMQGALAAFIDAGACDLRAAVAAIREVLDGG